MNWQSETAQRRFGVFAWAVLAYNIPVIVWGAYVRVSFSGDGCGANWPFCNGQVIPQHMAAPMAIEFTHRVMTSLDAIMIIALVAWTFLSFPRKHAVRTYTVWTLIFLLVEALLGAGLVLFRKVAHDQSAGRIWYLSGHLVNTMLLLGASTLTAWVSTTKSENFRLTTIRRAAIFALAVTMVVSITGVIAALGDTLFPVRSLAAGVRQDFASASGSLLRLRMLHPLIAVFGAICLFWIANRISRLSGSIRLRRSAKIVIYLTICQIVVGIANIGLLAPVWMQLFHLFMADLVWISVVIMALELAYFDAHEPFGSGQDKDHSGKRPQNDADRLYEWRHNGASTVL